MHSTSGFGPKEAGTFCCCCCCLIAYLCWTLCVKQHSSMIYLNKIRIIWYTWLIVYFVFMFSSMFACLPEITKWRTTWHGITCGQASKCCQEFHQTESKMTQKQIKKNFYTIKHFKSFVLIRLSESLWIFSRRQSYPETEHWHYRIVFNQNKWDFVVFWPTTRFYTGN